jgi:hypothetical protein
VHGQVVPQHWHRRRLSAMCRVIVLIAVARSRSRGSAGSALVVLLVLAPGTLFPGGDAADA